MLEKTSSRPDLLLLLSLVLVILMHPILDHGETRQVILGILIFVPVFMATIRLSEIKGWVWPAVLMTVATVAFGAFSIFYRNQIVVGIKWVSLAVFFGFAVVGLFPFLKNARSVTNAHLYTAVSIYLLLGLIWFALYSAFEVFFPGSIQLTHAGRDEQSEMLYFSLVTLSTIGYGDVVPIGGEARMLAALEGITGVLYVAITVALLVSAYKQRTKEE